MRVECTKALLFTAATGRPVGRAQPGYGAPPGHGAPDGPPPGGFGGPPGYGGWPGYSPPGNGRPPYPQRRSSGAGAVIAVLLIIALAAGAAAWVFFKESTRERRRLDSRGRHHGQARTPAVPIRVGLGRKLDSALRGERRPLGRAYVGGITERVVIVDAVHIGVPPGDTVLLESIVFEGRCALFAGVERVVATALFDEVVAELIRVAPAPREKEQEAGRHGDRDGPVHPPPPVELVEVATEDAVEEVVVAPTRSARAGVRRRSRGSQSCPQVTKQPATTD